MRDEYQPDILLARQITAGDQRALERFYELYADALFAFITQRLDGERQDVEDIWQDSLAAALRALPGYHGDSRLSTWLCASARRKVIDRLRAQGRNGLGLSTEADPEASLLIDQAPLPEEYVQKQSTRIRVLATLQALPEEYRLALTARYSDGKSTAEVSSLLGKSYKATESLLSRARRAFQQVFEDIPEKD